MRLRVGLLAFLILLCAATPAAAQSRSDRAAARQFAAATAQLERSARALRPAVQRRLDPLFARDCIGGLDLENLPAEAQEAALAAITVATFDAIFPPTRPALRRFVARLDGVRTDDRVLVCGRVAWRATARSLAALPSPPADLCAQLRRWRDAGYSSEAAPSVDLAPVERFVAQSARLERDLRAAVRRLRALGVGRRAAERFTGESSFGPLTALVPDVLPGESEAIDPPPDRAARS